MKHEPNRQVTEEEQKLWSEFREALDRSDYSPISVTQVATTHCGLHEERSRQIVATWENEGLVSASRARDHAGLTEYGRQVTDIESGMTSGESWR
jgi:hypothetical protein